MSDTDRHSDQIVDCPICSAWWPGRTVQDGADRIAEHVRQAMTEPTLDIEMTP